MDAHNEETSALAESVQRLSLATNTNISTSIPAASLNSPLKPRLSPKSPDRHESPLKQNPPRRLSTQTLRKAPTSPSLSHGKPADSPRRVSTASNSPVISRRTSTNFDKRSDNTPTKPLFGRTSSMNLAARSNMSGNDPLPIAASVEEVRKVTSSSIAEAHFEKELALHIGLDNPSKETLVIIHDACYGHRFSRPKTSKAGLGLIVERPERIQACAAGVAAAYVTLGGRHAASTNPPRPQKDPSSDLPFKIYRSTRSVPLNTTAVTNVHGMRWMNELTSMCTSAADKLASRGKELERPATPSASIKPKLHEGDLYLCKESLAAFQAALGGVLDGVDAVFGKQFASGLENENTKRAFIAIRPPGHHCSADMPSGFCWLNNVHIGIEHAAQMHGLTHAAIIDFDLHHGDGSQAVTWERNAKVAKLPKNSLAKRTSIGYFSIHDINSYPCEYGDQEKVQNASLCLENAHNQTIWNVHLQPWKTEEDFWELYETRYMVLLDKTRAYLKTQTERLQSFHPSTPPKAAIFISAGFDASEWEGEGMQRHKVNVPTEFYARFTSDINKLAEELGTSVEGRVISVLEGGYSDRALMSGVFSHVCGLVGSPQKPKAGLTNSITNCTSLAEDDIQISCYDKDWWAETMLRQFEALQNPIPIIAKKPKVTEPSTYATPTQSFTAKVVDPSKIMRSLSGIGPSHDQAILPSGPPPDIDWATATYELSKLLIPSDRQINSCRHEELSEPRAKARHSTIGIPVELPINEKRETRGRKAKTPAYGLDEVIQKKSSSSRRQTISELPSVSQHDISQDTNRPSTSDSKAASEESEGIRTQRPRRVSAGRADLMPKPVNQPPPVPKLPSKFASQSKVEPSVQQNGFTGQVDIDSLATAVKKITLRMPSKEPSPSAPDVTAKAMRKPAVPRSAASKPPSMKAAVPRVAKTKPVPPPAATAVKIESQTNSSSTIPAPMSSYLQQPPQPTNTIITPPIIPSQPLLPSTSIGTATTTLPSSTSANFIPYNPSAHYISREAQPQQQQQSKPPSDSLTWMPPNMNTPVASPMKRGGAGMPVFSANGAIPFAKKEEVKEAVGGSAVDGSAGGSVWDIPVTPVTKR